MFANLLYFVSTIAWYSFFFALAAGHAYFYIQSFYRDDCWASNNKHNNAVYTDSGQADKEHNISQNFRVVNMFGLIFFAFLSLTLMYLHARLSCDRYYDPHDAFFLWMFALFLLWCCYFLTLMIMRLRHAGCVCSGDFLPDKRLFHSEADPTYIHDNGNFLWYVMIAHAGFVVVMVSGAISIID